LRPWLVRIEQELCRKLIVPAQRGTYYVEHLVDAILRMDGKARADSYQVYFNMGVLDAEQIAEKENLPKPKPKPEPVPADPAAPPPGEPKPLTMNSKTFAADRANLMDAASRFVKREAYFVRRATKPGAILKRGFAEALDEFYRDESAVLRGYLLPAVRLSLACRGLEGDAVDVCRRLAEAYAERSKEELLDLPVKDLDAKADGLMARWEMSRAIELAEQILALQPEELRAGQPINVVVNVPAQAPASVTVNVPEQAPPSINVTVPEQQVTVNVPQQKPPDVRVDAPVTVNVPPQMPPDVNVTVPAPIVNVDAPVTVNVPSPAPLKVERDKATGLITGIAPKKG
jgi:hypothetical protein